eukprot:6482405-Amphidinium_carterae.2
MGHLRGLLDPKQVDGLLSTRDWVPSLRFGVKQKDKLRPVDDEKRTALENNRQEVGNGKELGVRRVSITTVPEAILSV